MAVSNGIAGPSQDGPVPSWDERWEGAYLYGLTHRAPVLGCLGLREATMAIAWRRDIDAVLSEAKGQGRHVLLDFSAAPT